MANQETSKSYEPQSHWRSQLMLSMQESSDTPPPSEINVGRRLQELRIIQGLSLRALAEISRLNVNTLSLIENEKTSPNVSTLQQLAAGLNVPITTFFESIVSQEPFVFQKAGERPETSFPQGILEDLGGGLALGEATPLLMTLDPNQSSNPEPIVHTGQEFLYCLEGRMAFFVGEKEFVLEPGDSLIFEAHIPHRWENRNDGHSRAILVICPADHADRLVSQHLKSSSSTSK
jgi:transcriptional regulator with XRE-family HTH domain